MVVWGTLEIKESLDQKDQLAKWGMVASLAMLDTLANLVAKGKKVKLVPMARRAKEGQEVQKAKMVEMDILVNQVWLGFLAVREKLENMDPGVHLGQKDLQLRKRPQNLHMDLNQAKRNPSMYTENQIK